MLTDHNSSNNHIASAPSCTFWRYLSPFVLPKSWISHQALPLLKHSLKSPLQCRATQDASGAVQGEDKRVHFSLRCVIHYSQYGRPVHPHPSHKAYTCGYSAHVFAGTLSAPQPGQSTGPDISRLAPHLQQEWDHAANAHLSRITVLPQSDRKVWWRSGTCKTGQSHRWQVAIKHRTDGTKCPFDSGMAVCPCTNLAHNHPEVAAEWDWEANGERTPETVAAKSCIKAAWRCALCGHRWISVVASRTLRGTGCPQCGREAGRFKARQPSIRDGAPHLLAKWDWKANKTHAWHPDRVTLGSAKQVHWVARDECKLGLVHGWQAAPQIRASKFKCDSPFPVGKAVCACNSLAVQCPEAADLWDHQANGHLTPDKVTLRSTGVVCWKAPDGRQWQQIVQQVVKKTQRRSATKRLG